MFKKTIVLMLIFLMVFSLAACGIRQDKKPQNDSRNGDIIVDPNPQETEEVEVTVYYVSNDYIMTGQGESLVPYETTILVGKESLEEAVLAELQKMPEDEELTTAVQTLKILSVETQNNIAYVNLSSEGLGAVGGSLQEILVISQIVWTLTELENIDKVQLLVDGSKRESLMGHISIDEPIGR